jgi:Bacterial Ig domain
VKTVKPAPAGAVLAAVVLGVSLALAPAAFAGKGGNHGGGGGGGGSCTTSAPTVAVQNNWEWGASGSWGLPGQQLAYDVEIINNDSGCGSSMFDLSVTAPNGFAVSIPTPTASVGSMSSAYLWFYVTSPADAADGDYPLTVSAQRTNGSSATAGTVYKLYSSDTSAPTLFWPNPGPGTTISGHSYNVTVTSSDDHAVKKIDLYLDGAYVSTTTCNDITYTCQLNYKWSPRAGPHTATFESYDWMGNVGTVTVSFTVS